MGSATGADHVIVLSFPVGAANHDRSQFSDAEKLRLDRVNPHSVPFGYGLHFSIGAALAALKPKLRSGRFTASPGMQLRTNAVEHHPVFHLRASKSLPIAAR